MLYSIDSGKYVTKVLHKKDFEKCMKNLSADDYRKIEDDMDFDYENGDFDRQWVESISASVSRHFRNRELIRQPVYGSIYKKIIGWIAYEENAPVTDYKYEPEIHDKYRSENDLDCILRGGDLHADTIFSLWTPLRFAIVRLNDGDYDKIEAVTKTKLDKNKAFLEQLLVDRNLEKLLPLDNETTRLLSELFVYGQHVENTMLLPDGWKRLNIERSKPPYHDYMPRFLYECFSGGAFCKAFKNDDSLISWINMEKLCCFFDGEIRKNNISDLVGSGDIKKNIPVDLNVMLRNYISILQKRKMNR